MEIATIELPKSILNAVKSQAPITGEWLEDSNLTGTLSESEDKSTKTFISTNSLIEIQLTIVSGRPSKLTVGFNSCNVGIESDCFLKTSINSLRVKHMFQ